MKVYIHYIMITAKALLKYPVNILIRTLGRFLFIYMQILFWKSLYYSNIGIVIANLNSTITYVTIANIIYTFMECNTVTWLNDKIRSGEISMDLIRPMNFGVYTLMVYIGESIVHFIINAVPLFLLTKYVLRINFFIYNSIWIFIASLIIGLIINFLYSYFIGLLAFWFYVTHPLNMMVNAVYKILSGAWIPVYYFPESIKYISECFPFQYIYYIPLSLLTTNMNAISIIRDFSAQLLWVVILFGLVILTWNKGFKKLVIQGG